MYETANNEEHKMIPFHKHIKVILIYSSFQKAIFLLLCL